MYGFVQQSQTKQQTKGDGQFKKSFDITANKLYIKDGHSPCDVTLILMPCGDLNHTLGS